MYGVAIMSNESKFVPLDSLAHVITKGTTPTQEQGYFEEGINFIRALSINENGQLDEETFLKISDETNSDLKRSIVQEGDVLFSIAGVIGRVAVTESKHLPANLNQALAIIRPKTDKINPHYLANLLRSHEAQYYFRSRVVESVQANLSLKELGRFPVKKLSLEEQNIRNKTLHLIEDKRKKEIDISDCSMNFISSLFRSWFIDFNPVKAKLKGEVPYGMNEETAALFPNNFEYLESVKLPAGWKIGSLSKLSNMFEVNPESTNSSFNNQEISYIDIASVGFGFLKSKPERMCYDDAPSRARRVVRQGDILISTVRPKRKSLIYIQKPLANTVASTGFAQLRAKNKNFSYFLLALVTNPQFTLELEMVAYGAAYPAVSTRDICSVPFALPPISIIEKFGETVESFVLQSSNSYEHNRTLDDIKSLLLPRLISGKLSIS